VGMSNAVNLVDGIDGLAGGISAIAAFFFGIYSLLLGNYATALFSLTLCGSLIGFLIYNFPPAKLFMGDSGSLFLGVIIAVFPLMSSSTPSSYTASFLIVLTLMIIPFLDTLTAILRRLRRKRPIHSADRDHLHHKLLYFGLKTDQILIFIYSCCIILGISLFSFIFFSQTVFFIIIIIEWIVGLTVFIVIERVYQHRHSGESPGNN
jgi:UDP-GlcNAc:undecaprenyl-phosphate GlcNAc-1-phosphate transferase